MNTVKKAIKSAVVSFCALVLAACGSNGGILAPKAPDLNKLFTMTANITQGEKSYALQLDRTEIGRWKVTFSEPYQLQGVSFIYSKEGVSACYDGLSAESLTDDFSSSLAAVIIRTLETAVQDNTGAVKYSENGFTLQSGECILSFPKSGDKPNSFEIPKEKIFGEITDFRFNEDLFSNGADVVIID